MSQAPYMPVFTDALLGDTMHLSVEQFGAYCLLLFATWRNNGKALPDDNVKMARICRCTERRWKHHLRPILVSFFDLSDGCWHQKRLEKEWLICAERTEVMSERGTRGARARWLRNKKTGILEPLPEQSVGNSTYTHTHNKSLNNGVSDSVGLPEQPWQQRCDGWARNGFWQPLWGPRPGENGCGAPADMARVATLIRDGASK